MLQEFALVLGLALLPAAGNFGGGLLAEFIRPSKRTLSHALHAAAGIIVAVVAVEVMPEALPILSGWLLSVAFVVGGVAYIVVDAAVERWQKRKGDGSAGPWMVYVAVAADLAGDGLLIGTGSAVGSGLAMLLAVGQVLADIPEGFATTATFRASGASRAARLWISASFAIPVVGAAILAFFVLRNASEALKMGSLVFVAGFYTVAAVEEILAQAHETRNDSRYSAVSFIAGFALFAFVSKTFSAGA